MPPCQLCRTTGKYQMSANACMVLCCARPHNSEIQMPTSACMVSVVVIPIVVVAIVGLLGYLVYRYLIADVSSRRAVKGILNQYDIDMTPLQIVHEYYKMRGEPLSEDDAQRVTKEHMRTDPDHFLEMYDELRASMPRRESTKDSDATRRRTSAVDDDDDDDGDGKDPQ